MIILTIIVAAVAFACIYLLYITQRQRPYTTNRIVFPDKVEQYTPNYSAFSITPQEQILVDHRDDDYDDAVDAAIAVDFLTDVAIESIAGPDAVVYGDDPQVDFDSGGGDFGGAGDTDSW